MVATGLAVVGSADHAHGSASAESAGRASPALFGDGPGTGGVAGAVGPFFAVGVEGADDAMAGKFACWTACERLDVAGEVLNLVEGDDPPWCHAAPTIRACGPLLLKTKDQRIAERVARRLCRVARAAGINRDPDSARLAPYLLHGRAGGGVPTSQEPLDGVRYDMIRTNLDWHAAMRSLPNSPGGLDVVQQGPGASEPTARRRRPGAGRQRWPPSQQGQDRIVDLDPGGFAPRRSERPLMNSASQLVTCAKMVGNRPQATHQSFEGLAVISRRFGAPIAPDAAWADGHRVGT